MYKWAIFESEQAAIDLKNACNAIAPGPVTFAGAPPHVVPAMVDYTMVIKHFQQDLWAVLVDEAAIKLVPEGIQLTDPDPSWFQIPPGHPAYSGQ